MAGPGQSAQVILNGVPIRDGERCRRRDGEPAVLAAQLEQANREIRQAPEDERPAPPIGSRSPDWNNSASLVAVE